MIKEGNAYMDNTDQETMQVTNTVDNLLLLFLVYS